ncbi:MAG: Spermidine/putrescine transport system permease protein PotB [Actinomycetota bacterium]
MAIPILYLIRRALDSESQTIATVVLRRKTLEILLTTLGLTTLVVVLATIVGVTMAWILHNVELPFANLFRALVILPIAIPSYVFTFSWISLYPSLQGFLAAVFVLVLSTTPFVTLAALSALKRVDWSQHEVAQTLGLNTAATFFKVTLPQIRNSVTAGSLLVALYVLSDFGAVSLLGVDTFTRSIANLYRGSFDRSTAAVLALILVVISAVIIAIESRTRSRSKLVKSSTRIITTPQLIKALKSRVIATFIAVTYVFLSLVLPLALLVIRFISNTTNIDYSNLMRAAISTIIASSLGAFIALLLALPLGILVQQGSGLAWVADKGVLMVHALPGIVMGLALVAFGSEFRWLYQTLGLLAFAYALLFMAKSVGAVRTSLSRVPQNLVDISATLGQSRSKTLRKVVLPLSAPGILSGTLLVFLAAMKELPATLMLRPTGFETLATEMWTYTSIFRFSEAAPYALLLVLVAAIPTFLINRPDKNDSGEGDPS